MIALSTCFSSIASAPVYADDNSDISVSMLGRYADTELVDYLEENSIQLESDDVITVQEEDGIKTLQVKHTEQKTQDIKIVEYSTLVAYSDEDGSITPTDVSVKANPYARSRKSIKFYPNNCDITVTGYVTYKMTSTDSYLTTSYCRPSNVSFIYSVNSSNHGTVEEIDVGIFCGGVLCDSSFNPVQDEFSFEIVKGKVSPTVGVRYSQSEDLSSYGGTWIRLVAHNYSGFSMTFQVKSGGSWDAHTQNINF